MTEKDIYLFYSERVKVLYSEIEARNNTLPIELLFEIHSAFDHLKRFHVDGEPEEKCADKAFSHLKRGMLDAFKLKLKYHNADYEKLIKQKTDLRLIDSGKFLPQLLEARKNIIQTARTARIAEGQDKIDTAFEKWYELSMLIDEFETCYFDPRKIQWARRQGVFHFSTNFIIGLITGVLASILASIVISKFL
ncbi:hypothetical protein AGMMS4956_05620 [Bacteroidia bacterium]|nr:hypothetical protein AGMMS4956_05620 [Bacteroidia bacterium]